MMSYFCLLFGKGVLFWLGVFHFEDSVSPASNTRSQTRIARVLLCASDRTAYRTDPGEALLRLDTVQPELKAPLQSSKYTCSKNNYSMVILHQNSS